MAARRRSRPGKEKDMKRRYLPTIIDIRGKEYTNVAYTTLAEAMDALQELVDIFEQQNDAVVAQVFVRNIVTGKCIYR